jgi:hypothetical protein
MHSFKIVKILSIKMSILLPKHYEFLYYQLKESFILSKIFIFKYRLICNFIKKKIYIFQKGICVSCKFTLIKKNECYHLINFDNFNFLLFKIKKLKIEYKFVTNFNNFILIHKTCYNKTIRNNFLLYLKKPNAKKLAF